MRTLCLILLSTISSAVLAQSTSGGSIYFYPNLQVFSFQNLNQSFSQAGFEDVPITAGFGVGGFGQFNRWRLGGEGTYFSGGKSNEITSTETEGGWGYFYSGYVIGSTWRMIPAVGIGWGGLTVNAIQSAQVSFPEFLTTAPNTSRVSLGDVFLHSALTLERMLGKHHYLGAKVTYNLGLSGSQDWSANGLVNSVSDPFRGIQASLVFGFNLN